MKRERSKVHNHSTSQVISRSSTPTNNLISSKDYVNYSSLSLTQLHYTFGSAAYKLHDGLYGCIVILTIVFCVGQSFLVYGENPKMWHFPQISSSLAVITYIFNRGVMVQHRRTIPTKHKWLFLLGNGLLLSTLIAAIKSSTFSFTSMTIFNWVVLFSLLNLPLIVAAVLINCRVQPYFRCMKGIDGHLPIDLDSTMKLSYFMLSWQSLLSIPQESCSSEHDQSYLTIPSQLAEADNSNHYMSNMDTFTIKQEQLTVEHLAARLLCLVIFLATLLTQSIGIVYISVGSPLIVATLRHEHKLNVQYLDGVALLIVASLVLPLLIVLHSFFLCRVSLMRYVEYIRFLLDRYVKLQNGQSSLHTQCLYLIVCLIHKGLYKDIYGVTKIGQQFSMLSLAGAISLVVGMVIMVGTIVAGASWRFQVVSIISLLILQATMVVLFKFGNEDFMKQKLSNLTNPHDVIFSGLNKPSHADHNQLKGAAAKILNDTSFAEKLAIYKELCSIYNRSQFSRTLVTQNQLANNSCYSSAISNVAGPIKHVDTRKELQRKHSK